MKARLRGTARCGAPFSLLRIFAVWVVPTKIASWAKIAATVLL